MEKWAERIKTLLDAGKKSGLTQTGLAKACGIAQPTVSQWFNDNDSKPATVMIMADNMVSAARYLGTTAEWIITGKGAAQSQSQPARLDPERLATAIGTVDAVIARARLAPSPLSRAAAIAGLYAELNDGDATGNAAATVATILELLGNSK